MTLLVLCFLLAFLPAVILSAGETLAAGETYSFSDSPEWLELKSFSAPENGGRWTRGGRAAILLKLEDPELLRNSRIDFNLVPFSAPGRKTLQRATLYCGYTSTRPSASWECTGPGIYSLVPKISDVKDGILTIFLFLPDASPSYGSDGAVNPNSLGLFFRSVTLIRKTPFRLMKKQKKVSAHLAKEKPAAAAPVKEELAAAAPVEKKVPKKEPSAELPVLQENQWYSLSDDARFFRLSGFSVPERGGRWTSGEESEIEMKLPELEAMPLPALEFQIHVPRKESRTVTLILNDLGIGQWNCREKSGCYKILLGTLPRSGGTVRLHFSVPDARVPEGLEEIPGARKLGVRILALRLIPDGRVRPAEFPVPEKQMSALTKENLIELVPGKTVRPGRNEKRLILEGFSAPEPDGSVYNVGKKCLVTFRLPALFQREPSVAVLDIEPILNLGVPVRYINVLIDGQPIDSWASVKKARHYLRLNKIEKPFVTLTLDMENGTERKAEKGFRLLGVTLYDRNKPIPLSQLEQEKEADDLKKDQEEQQEKEQIFQKDKKQDNHEN